MNRMWIKSMACLMAMAALLLWGTQESMAQLDLESEVDPPYEASEIFEAPVRLRAEDGFVDTGASRGHSGPCLSDVDGDGLRDLVVGSFDGKFRLYRNVETNQEPSYAKFEHIQAGGEDAKVWIYCCIGSSPQFHDFDGDGIDDLLSGSYDPGEVYWFRGLGEGLFEARQTIVDREGKPVLRHPDQKQNYQSFGSWISMVDWENDGDLDLLLGGFHGEMFVRVNEGTRREPAYSVDNTPILIDGQPIKVPKGHAAIDVADWNNDGLWDIVSGSDNGGVYWFENVGTPEVASFTGPHELLPPHQGDGYREIIEVGVAPRPGIRSQIDVVDYNLDGKLDLLVGDFCTTRTLRPDLTDAERDEFTKLHTEQREAIQYMVDRVDKLWKEF
ncbi:MAG: VCBS repeat-containing protein, partial [Planctomycetaceae bacterium]|nr:VCBS repeat-containing protein [Planctomycetaceae bacterium]